MAQPLFFVSYARPHENSRKPIHKAVDKLRTRVAELLGRNNASLDEIGFFDVDNIQNGADWDLRLAPAVSSIGVVVCFCSPGYFNSPYCSNEFDAFRRRFDSADGELQGRTPGPLIPIIWDFDPCGVIPAALKRFHQPGDRNFPKSYEKEGLSTLARLPVRHADFDKTINTIAVYIIRAAGPPRLKPLVPVARFSELASSLHNPKPGPYHLAVTVFHENGARWRADVVGPRITDAVERVADKTRVGWREIVASDLLLSGATEAAKERAAHIFVVPESLAGSEPWKTRLDQIGGSTLAAGALLVAADAGLTPASEAVVRVQQVVPSLAGRGFLTGSFDPNLPDDIDIRLMELVTQLRTRLIKEDQPSKVESPEHEAAAQTAGVPISSRPIVSGSVQSAGSAKRTIT